MIGKCKVESKGHTGGGNGGVMSVIVGVCLNISRGWGKS